MISFIATWDGQQIVYVVVDNGEAIPFPGENSFSLAWAFFQSKSHNLRRRLTEKAAKARIEQENLVESQSRMVGNFLGLDLIHNQNLQYWLFEEDYTVVKSRISVDEAVQLSAAAPGI